MPYHYTPCGRPQRWPTARQTACDCLTIPLSYPFVVWHEKSPPKLKTFLRRFKDQRLFHIVLSYFLVQWFLLSNNTKMSLENCRWFIFHCFRCVQERCTPWCHACQSLQSRCVRRSVSKWLKDGRMPAALQAVRPFWGWPAHRVQKGRAWRTIARI
jgi:hypothetical protein